MFRQFLVVFVFQNGVFSFHNDNDLPTSALIKLISKVIENDKEDNIRYEKIGDRADLPIDLEYYDFNSNSFNNNKDEEDSNISSDLLREEDDNPRTKEVRIHVIQNPEVLEQYQNLLYYKRHPSNVKPKFQTKIYKSLTLADLISHLRRNAAFRIDTISSENNKNDEKRQHSQKLNSEMKTNKYDDDFYGPKAKKDDWDISTKNNKGKNSREIRSRNSDIEWNSKKKPGNFITEKKTNWDDNYKTKDRNTRNKDTNYKPFDKNSDSFKDSKRKPSESVSNNRDTIYKPLKTDNYKEFNSKRKESNFRPLRLSEHFKPHYKPFKSDSEKKHDRNNDYKVPDKPIYKDDYKISNKRDKPVYKESNYVPKIKDISVERRPRPKISNILGGTYGRTPIPYAGHRGIYEEK